MKNAGVKDIFLDLVSFDTASDPENEACPSSPGQLVIADRIVEYMRAIGIRDAVKDENGYVFGSIPANADGAPTIGLIAHMDTSPDVSGKNVNPKITPPYDGGDIILGSARVLSPKEFPSLLCHVGKHLIVTDGETLLGADDKAGVAEILAAAARIIKSDAPHGKVCIGFTPDEEIGRGADLFDVERFGADFAYTVDGGAIGGIEYENFNAASARVELFGVNIHPGAAKGKMKNAALRAIEFNSLLPANEIPACTDGYEGFFHLTDMRGDESYAVLSYIIRDHDADKFEKRKALILSAADYLNEKYGEGSVKVSVTDSYKNMKEMILPHFHIVERAVRAMEELGISAESVPVRGGTDGARLSFMGLPCPNLSTGGENFHSRFEYIPLEDMEKMVDVLERIIFIGE